MIKALKIFFLVLFTSCVFPGTTTVVSEPPVVVPGQCILITENSFTLAWDGGGDVFNIYQKSSGEWELMGHTTENTFEVNHILDGIYSYAVTSVHKGIESEMHTSEDDTAHPESWYIDWRLK